MLQNTAFLMRLPGNPTWLVYPKAGMNLSAAQAYCRANGGELVTLKIDSDDWQLALAVAAYNVTYIRVGLKLEGGATDARIVSSWRWLSTNQEPPFRNWKDGYPGKIPPSGSPVSNGCGYVIADPNKRDNPDKGQWVSLACSEQTGVACQLGEGPVAAASGAGAQQDCKPGGQMAGEGGWRV